MAVPKKGWRKLTVEATEYYWRAIGTDWGISVVVATENAFRRGATAQQLRFSLDYDQRRVPFTTAHGEGVSLHQRAAVAPGIVHAAIESSLALPRPFTG